MVMARPANISNSFERTAHSQVQENIGMPLTHMNFGIQSIVS